MASPLSASDSTRFGFLIKHFKACLSVPVKLTLNHSTDILPKSYGVDFRQHWSILQALLGNSPTHLSMNLSFNVRKPFVRSLYILQLGPSNCGEWIKDQPFSSSNNAAGESKPRQVHQIIPILGGIMLSILSPLYGQGLGASNYFLLNTCTVL